MPPITHNEKLPVERLAPTGCQNGNNVNQNIGGVVGADGTLNDTSSETEEARQEKTGVSAKRMKIKNTEIWFYVL